MERVIDKILEGVTSNAYLFEFSIFLRRVGIIKAHNQGTLVVLLVVLIEQSGFCMTDMQVSRCRKRRISGTCDSSKS